MRAALALTLGLALTTPPPALAESPRSVISWLSDVISQPEPGPGGPIALDPRTAAVTPFEESEIVTSSLDDPEKDGVGLLSSETTGLPHDLWSSTSALRVRSLIYRLDPAGVPAARALYHRILVTEAEAPVGSGPSNSLLLARVDALMATGRLDEALSLLQAAGVTDAQRFRRAFDISLLTDTAEPWCERLRDAPGLSPTLTARVYCLARLGDWSAAALTLNLGREVGGISDAEEALIARFLDPTLYEGATPPPIPNPLKTLDFILREAIALPRPATALPLAFSVVDAHDDTALRTRISARERLTRASALPPAPLFEAYRAGAPAASGGVWDRVAAVQNLDRAFATADLGAIAKHLVTADTLFSDAGLRTALAQTYATQLAALPKDGFSPSNQHRIAALLLLAGRGAQADPWFPSSNVAGDAFLSRLVQEEPDFSGLENLSGIETAVVKGLTARRPPSDLASELSANLVDGAVGEVLLRTLDLLQAGVEIDPGDLADALFLLRAAGQEATARQVAIETLLLLPEA